MWHCFKAPAVIRRDSKQIVTVGILTVTIISILWPDLASHSGVLLLALVTNLVWIWS